MKKQSLRFLAIAASAVLTIGTVSHLLQQKAIAQNAPAGLADQLVSVGGTVTFSVTPVAGASYQWLRNGAPLASQTGDTLTLENVQITDAGYYSCNVTEGGTVVDAAAASGAAGAAASTASLMVFTAGPDDDVVVYAAPIVSSGGSGTCPGPYQGYVTYTKTVQQGWGWTPETNTTVFTASDITRTNTKVEYVGAYGDEGCAQTSVTIPNPPASPAYRFAIYFPNNVPTTNYPISLVGFNP